MPPTTTRPRRSPLTPAAPIPPGPGPAERGAAGAGGFVPVQPLLPLAECPEAQRWCLAKAAALAECGDIELLVQRLESREQDDRLRFQPGEPEPRR